MPEALPVLSQDYFDGDAQELKAVSPDGRVKDVAAARLPVLPGLKEGLRPDSQ